MSTQVVKYQPELYSDVNHTEAPQVVVMSGTENRRIETSTATTHTSSATSFRVRTPDPKSVISRRMYLEIPVKVTATAAGSGVTTWTKFAPEPWCVYNAMDSIEIDFNGTKLSQNVNDCFQACIAHFHKNSKMRSTFGCPTMPNMSASHANLQTAVGPWNPYNTDLVGGLGVEPGRASSVWYTAGAVATGVQTRTYKFCVPLWGPFLQFDEDNPSGFSNLSQFNITIKWSTNWAELMFGRADEVIGTYAGDDTTLTSATLETGTSPVLLYETYTAVNSIPAPVLQYEGKEYYVGRKTIQTTDVDVGTAAQNAGMLIDAQSDLIGMSTIPERMFVYFQQPTSDFTYDDAVGTFADMTALTITFKNKQYTFNETQMQLIYMQSLRNGYDVPYGYVNSLASSGGKGLVACFHFGKDIGLEPNEFPGSPTNSTLQVRATAVNNGPARKLDMYVVLERDMRLYLGDNSGSKVQYGLTNEEQMAATSLPFSNMHESDTKVSGGGFKKHGKNLLKVGEQLLNHLHKQQKNIDNGLKYVDKLRHENATSGGSLVAGSLVGGSGYQNRFP